jgi:hypothetical protein
LRSSLALRYGVCMVGMEVVLRYRGRTVTAQDVVEIRRLICAEPTQSRRSLSQKVCRAWNWVRRNGTLCDMVCRSLLLVLERADHLELPPPRRKMANPLAHRRRPPRVELDRAPVRGSLAELGPLTYRSVRRTPDEAVFNSLIEHHHYLGYTQPVGAHLKYLVFAAERPVAALSFASPARHLRPRDRFLGWSDEAREQNVHRIAYNPRFLIPPWVEVPHLASHVLGTIARRLPGDWKQTYGDELLFLETFVDADRYRGTCYRAANWIVLGETTGRGHRAPSKKKTRSSKQVLGYPLSRNYREALCAVTA